MSGDRPRAEVQSVHRALDMLEAIGHRGDAGVSELAREAGLAVSTTHNLLRTLVRRGYLISADGRYHLGPAVSVISSRFDPVLALPDAVKPVARRVSDTSGLATTAAVLVSGSAQVLWHEPGSGSLTVSPPSSAASHPFGMATGRLLVAMTRQSDWHSFIAGAGDVEPGWSHARWTGYLADVAKTAVCVKRARDTHGYTAIATPIWSGDGAVICSIGCASPEFLATPELLARTLDILWAAAVDLSGQLGCRTIPFAKPALAVNQDH